ncbi:MAG: DUF192 domain-containing protein [Patescibacteria group bacterium]|nr:DUF192 domain-containing protein [Patescibacteria group bacterium]
MKFVYLFLAAALVAALALAYRNGVFDIDRSNGYKRTAVVIRGERFRVDVADSASKRALGLGGREPLAADEGMLFIFPSSANRSFWMKDVSFSIDIVWIAGDRVVGFAKEVESQVGEPIHQLIRYHSPEAVDKVLEVASGTVDGVGMMVGDGVNVKLEE